MRIYAHLLIDVNVFLPSKQFQGFYFMYWFHVRTILVGRHWNRIYKSNTKQIRILMVPCAAISSLRRLTKSCDKHLSVKLGCSPWWKLFNQVLWEKQKRLTLVIPKLSKIPMTRSECLLDVVHRLHFNLNSFHSWSVHGHPTSLHSPSHLQGQQWSTGLQRSNSSVSSSVFTFGFGS